MSRTLVVILVAGCGGAAAPPQAPAWPAGTVLAVDGVPVSAEEVEPLARDVGEAYPEYTQPQRRRLALTNGILQRAAARAHHREARERARTDCTRARERPEELAPRAIQGSLGALGLELWGAARRLEPGRWSEPIELAGRFVLLRLEERTSAEDPLEEALRLSLVEFPYVDPSSPGPALERALDESRLAIVDPAWDECVPEDWKHRMRGGER